MTEVTMSSGRLFVQRYYELRRKVLTTTPRDADPSRLFEEFARAALPEFATWLAVIDQSTGVSFSQCASTHEHSARACAHEWANDLDVEMVVDIVMEESRDSWPVHPVALDYPNVVVTALIVDDQRVGVILVARDPGTPSWRSDEIGAIHDAVTALGVDLERLRLRHQSRQAVRDSQRVASQLHQLISASLAVGTLHDEESIVLSLAQSARSVFGANRAFIALGDSGQQVVGFAHRSRAPRLIDDGDISQLGAPQLRLDASDPWIDDDWLCAPVLDSQRHSRGVLAAQRTSAGRFTDEDRELAMLLGQLAATSLESLELSRTIQDNEARLRILVDAAPIGIVESDSTGSVRWWNRSASRLLRWPDFNATDTTVVTWPSDVHSALSSLWSELLAGGVRDTHEFTARIGTRERLVASSAAVLPSGGGAPRLLTLLDDITDQRELREEVRHAHRMELRGQVASGVAHDFNNLITLILGYTELLSREVDGDKSSGLIRDIQAVSARASTLTAQLQSIGRTSEPAPVRLDIGAALSSNAEVLERIMGSKNTIVWALADDTALVMIDADLFEQMVLNLSINARDAMPEGGTLTFATATRQLVHGATDQPTLPAGDYVVLTISDTGIGMDDDTMARCFEPLFTTKGPFKGTGLGLASARRLVEESGGAISCASQLGVGTTFTIWLPVPAAAPIASAVAKSSNVAPTARARLAATILLVEDDPGLRRLALQVLQRNGLVVHEAASAEEALERYQLFSEPLDLLVSDVVLPVMTGDELAVRLQREQPDLGVLLMSGTASANVLDALAPHTAAFLAKPFKPSALVDEVMALLNRRSAARR